MKLFASVLWLCCALILLLSICPETEARRCGRGEILRVVTCPRTCKNTKPCSGPKTKQCVCRGHYLRNEATGKCVKPQACPP